MVLKKISEMTQSAVRVAGLGGVGMSEIFHIPCCPLGPLPFRSQVMIKQNNLHFNVSFSKDLNVIVDFKKHLSCRVSYCFIFNL